MDGNAKNGHGKNTAGTNAMKRQEKYAKRYVNDYKDGGFQRKWKKKLN